MSRSSSCIGAFALEEAATSSRLCGLASLGEDLVVCEGTGWTRCAVVLSLELGPGSCGDASARAPAPRGSPCSSASAGAAEGRGGEDSGKLRSYSLH